MTDIITQAEPDGFSKDILGGARTKSSFETLEYYVNNDACVRDKNSSPYNSYPLLFKGFILNYKGVFYRARRTPISSDYLYMKMSDQEVHERMGVELVLTSMGTLKKAYDFVDEYKYSPGWVAIRKDLQAFFNDSSEITSEEDDKTMGKKMKPDYLDEIVENNKNSLH